MKFLRQYGVLLLAIAALVFLKFQGTELSPEENDAYCEQLISEGKSAEALAWSREASDEKWRTIYEYDNARSAAIIEEIYELGAQKVVAADIDSDPDIGETTDVLIVTLPNDANNEQSFYGTRIIWHDGPA